MPKKYEFTNETKTFLGRSLYRIRALIAFGDVEAGELGGWIEKEENLAQEGNTWVYGNACVFGNARVYGNARIYGNALVYGDARVYDNACVYGNALVCKSTHLLQIGAIGSRNGFTTFARSKDKQILVACGCFRGTIDEFEAQVKKVHAGTKHEKTYLAAIKLAKLQIDDTEVKADA